MPRTNLLHYPILLSVILFLHNDSFSQNLVPNPNFEIFNSCPFGFGAGGPLQATPWQSATLGSADYLHTCASPENVGVPANFFGTQEPRSGEAYAGLYAWYHQFVYREYLQVQLTEPLIAGLQYEVKFFVSLSETSCAVQNMSVYFSAERPGSGGIGPLAVIPQINANLGYISDKQNWILVSGCYLAKGGEQWMTIGNFDSEENTIIQPGCNDTPSYYYIEDVSVQINDTCALPPLIEGTVKTKNGKPVSDAIMQLSQDPDLILPDTYNTDQDGYYSFNFLTPDSTYYVRGSKNTNVLQGVSTLDLITMQKHLLGRNLFTSLYQYIASDIDKNGIVTVMDAVELRKTILGYYNEFPQNTSWRLGVLPQDFSGSDISSFQETAIISSLQDSVTKIDFRGIKIGDVNESIAINANDTPIENRNDKSISLLLPDVKTERGATFTIDAKASEDLSIAGLQLALTCRDLALVSIEGIAINVADENVSFTENGLLRLSWNHDQGVIVSENDILFRLTFMSDFSGFLSDKITLGSEILEPEIYLGSQLMTHDLDIGFVETAKESQMFGFNIEPNPITNESVIRFDLLEAGEVEFQFYDLSGRLFHNIQNQYEAGSQTVLIDLQDFRKTEGIILCKIVSHGYTGTKKLVYLK